MSQLQSSASFPALGSVAFVAVSDPRGLQDARAAVERTVSEFDLACSRFRSDSELSALNAGAGTEVRVSPLLLGAVSAALRAARLTDGDVDPTVGEALIALGYDRDFESLLGAGPSGPCEREFESARGAGSSGPREPDSESARGARRSAPRKVSITSVPGWRTVRVDPERSTIRLARGVKLDLGATAKALASDRAAQRAGELAGCGVLVALGGDIATFGPAPRDPGAWRIRVTDDHRAGVEAPGQWISIASGGLATSSTTVRRWPAAGTAFAHHLIDPATGTPVDAVWRTVSVCAASCLDANIASTAAVVRGGTAAQWLSELGLPSRLVSTAGTVAHVAGWPADGDELDPWVASPAAEPVGR